MAKLASNRLPASKRVMATMILAIAACTANNDGSKKAGRSERKDSAAPIRADAKPEPQSQKKVESPPRPTQPTEQKADANPYRKNQVPPVGMTPEQIKQYVAAQGDPMAGVFSLEQAFEGDAALADREKGKLYAVFETSMGKFSCELFEDKTPVTIANFVGLARGLRPTYDRKKDEWQTIRYFDGNLFHRVIENFMIQTGDPTNSGTGFPGYVIVDEIDKSLRHNKAGILSMANRGPNTGSSQFFVTVRATPHLDDKHTVFGQCEPKIPVEISKVKVDPRFNHRPLEPVKIEKVAIERRKK